MGVIEAHTYPKKSPPDYLDLGAFSALQFGSLAFPIDEDVVRRVIGNSPTRNVLYSVDGIEVELFDETHCVSCCVIGCSSFNAAESQLRFSLQHLSGK